MILLPIKISVIYYELKLQKKTYASGGFKEY